MYTFIPVKNQFLPRVYNHNSRIQPLTAFPARHNKRGSCRKDSVDAKYHSDSGHIFTTSSPAIDAAS